MSRPKVRSLFVVLASLAFVGVGCGVTAGEGATGVSTGAAPASASPVALRKAAERTQALTSLKVHAEVATSAGEAGEFTVTADGEVDTASGRSHIKTGYEGDASLLGSLEMETVTDGKAVYIKSDLFSTFTDGKPWVKVPVGDAASISSLQQGLKSGSTDVLAFLEDIGTSEVETLGVDYVRGVETRHVRTEIDLAASLDEASGEQKDRLESQIEGLGASLDGLKPVPVDVWLDGDGFVRKFKMTIDLAGLSGTSSAEVASVTQTIEMYDFDKPVDIALPAADQVSEFDPSTMLGD